MSETDASEPETTPPDTGGTPPGNEPRKLTRRERLEARIREGRERLEAARSTSTTVGFAFDALSYDTDTGAPVLAAALGFRVFLFQVPYVCFFVIIAGFVADMTGSDAHSMFKGTGIAKLTAQSVQGAADLSGWARFTGLVLAAYALFLTARAFVKVINIVHALVWNVPRVRMARATRAALFFILFVTIALAISAVIEHFRTQYLLSNIISLALFTLVPFGMWWFVSWLLPHRDCPMIALAPGAALFAVGVEILHIVTVVWFPRHLQSKSELYGTVGTAVALLLWAYLLGRLMTLAAVLNAALWARFGRESAHPIELHRPSWRVPLIDDKLGRMWSVMFGDEEHPDPEAPTTPPNAGESGDDRDLGAAS